VRQISSPTSLAHFRGAKGDYPQGLTEVSFIPQPWECPNAKCEMFGDGFSPGR
jgi:hypothetical protein